MLRVMIQTFFLSFRRKEQGAEEGRAWEGDWALPMCPCMLSQYTPLNQWHNHTHGEQPKENRRNDANPNSPAV